MTIVVGVDGSAASEHSLVWALREGERRHAPVQLVHGWTYAIGGHVAVAETLELLALASQALLDGVLASARAAAPGLEISGLLVPRPPSAALLDAAAADDAELLVVGSRGHRSLSAFFIGSVADSCARHASVPVAVIRPEAVEHAGGSIVVGVDGSEPSIAALRWARAESALRGVPVVAVHAWQDHYSTELAVMAGVSDATLEREANEVLTRAVDATATAGSSVTALIRRDLPGPALLEESETARMVVVGSRGRGGFADLLLGSVSRRCVHEASCPVVVVRD